MVTSDIGRLPVVVAGKLVGIVTRTDVLRGWEQQRQLGSIANTLDTPPTPPYQGVAPSPWKGEGWGGVKISAALPTSSNTRQIAAPLALEQLQTNLAPQLWELLLTAAQAAQKLGWHLYLVGGAVRDLLLADAIDELSLQDIDLVVDGFHQAADVGAGVKLATALQELYPVAHLEIHGAFQTAALQWDSDPDLGALGIDIATARTEFYPYPAANPEVEASSIRQDLYRRDFTINAMALRLTPGAGAPFVGLFWWGDGFTS